MDMFNTPEWQYRFYIVFLYIKNYLTGPRILVFILTVAVILSIKKILIERIDMETKNNKNSLGINDMVLVLKYIGYSIKNANKYRLTFAEWKEDISASGN